MRDFFFLIFGALIGSLSTRQYDQYKERDIERHILMLAAKEAEDFESDLLCWKAFPHWYGPLKVISDEHIKSFLRTKLSFLLPSEIREDFKQISDWIAGSNQLVKQFVDAPLSETVAMKLSEHASIYEKYFHENFVHIWNSILYTRSVRYIFFGIRPEYSGILRSRSPQELVELQIELEGI